MPDWLAANIGTVLTVGGSITVAIIAGGFGLWAKNHTPKQPVPIQDVWSENRSLRADLLGVERRFDLLDIDYRKALTALDVLWRYVQRVKNAWGNQPDMPALTATERRTLASLIDDIDTPGAGSPVASN
jgi:hypothetical protein